MHVSRGIATARLTWIMLVVRIIIRSEITDGLASTIRGMIEDVIITARRRRCRNSCRDLKYVGNQVSYAD